MKISVCIATYNQAAYLEQSIKSVFTQTLQPFEVIVSNDCSTDDTKLILDRLSSEYKNLKVIHQPINLGMVKNTNVCLKVATGDYVVKLDSDDYLLPDYIEELSLLLDTYPEAGYAHGSVQEIDGFGKNGTIRTLFRKTGFVDGDTALKSCVKGYKVAANIIMFRRSVLSGANYITSNVDFAEDYYLSAQIAALGFGNVYNEKILSCYRVWADNGNVRQKRKLNEINGLRIIFEEVIQPAFTLKGWNAEITAKARARFANKQSSCLGWTIYSNEEKKELEKAIFQLSNGLITHVYVKIYKLGYGEVIHFYQALLNWLKQIAKSILLSRNKIST
ncbi:glycosyltransferase family 2 protein [Spirosoma areae]